MGEAPASPGSGPSGRSGRAGLVLVAFACALVIVWMMVASGGGRAPAAGGPSERDLAEAAASGASASGEPSDEGEAAARRRLARATADAGPRLAPALDSPEFASAALADARRAHEFPPSSRPLGRETHPDLIEWNGRHESARGASDDPDLRILYTGDVYWLTGSAAEAHTWLEVTRDGAPIDVTVSEAHLLALADGGEPLAEPTIVPLQYRREGDRWVATLRPAELFPAITRNVRLRATIVFDVGLPSPEAQSLELVYIPDSAVPARFTGRFREEVEDGSLAVYAELEVLRGGWFVIDANLWDARDEPVAFSSSAGALEPGTHEVRLLFFGRVLRLSGSSPPWHLGELRGMRIDESARPARERVPPYEGRYETRSYEGTTFSDDTWRSPVAARREAELERLAREGAVLTPAEDEAAP